MYKIRIIINILKQNKVINLVVFLTLTTVVLLSYLLLSIMSSSDYQIRNQQQNFGNAVTIEQNPEQIRREYSSNNNNAHSSNITVDELNKYSQSKYVKTASFMQYIKIYENDLKVNKSNVNFDFIYTYKILGLEEKYIEKYLLDKDLVLTKGRLPKNEGEIVVPAPLLNTFNIEVGDQIKIITEFEHEIPTENPKKSINTYSELYKLKIVGSYQNVDNIEKTPKTLLTNYDTYQLTTNEYTSTHATYILKNYNNMNKFINEINLGGLPEGYYINKHDEELQERINPLKSLSAVCNNLLIVILLLAGLVIFINSLIMLYHRKSEIKVLRALGQTRFRTLKQFINEIVVIFVLALLLGASVAIVIVEPVSDMVINNFTKINVDDCNMEFSNEDSIDKTCHQNEDSAEILNEYDIKVKIKNMILTILLTIGVMMIKLVVIGNYIQKYDIKELLREQSE